PPGLAEEQADGGNDLVRGETGEEIRHEPRELEAAPRAPERLAQRGELAERGGHPERRRAARIAVKIPADRRRCCSRRARSAPRRSADTRALHGGRADRAPARRPVPEPPGSRGRRSSA